MQRDKEKVAVSSVLASAGLTTVKFIVGVLTGSLGILSEAAHSALDFAAALTTYVSVRTSGKPADQDHLYGHGKVENLSGLVETILLLATCVWIIYEALIRLLVRSVKVEASLAAFGILFVSIAVDVSRSRALYRAARKYDSQALEADALHFSSDVYSSAVVIAGLVLVRFGLEFADAIAAMGVATIVVLAGLRLGKRTVDALLDRAPAGLASQLQSEVMKIPGVIACRQVRVRRSGPFTFIDMRVSAPRTAAFEKAHEIAAEAEKTIRRIVPNADIVVHMDPVATPVEGAAQKIRAIASQTPSIIGVHNLNIHEIEGKLLIDLHIEVDRSLSLKEAHDVASRLEEKVRAELKNVADVLTHLESTSGSVLVEHEVSNGERKLVSEITSLISGIQGVKGVHKVNIRNISGRLYISLHILTDATASMVAAHELSTKVESLVKERIRDVEQVLVHCEPQ
jgi:cation diffusion facilitator family transporter